MLRARRWFDGEMSKALLGREEMRLETYKEGVTSGMWGR